MIGDDYQMRYDLERRAHRITRQKLEKAVHDRDRYRRRIRLEQEQRKKLAQELKYARLELGIIKMCLNALEKEFYE